jgi:hypothetical protein
LLTQRNFRARSVIKPFESTFHRRDVMKKMRSTALIAGTAAVLAGAFVPTAGAVPTGSSAQSKACVIDVDSVRANGNYAGARIEATTPPTSETGPGTKAFAPGTVKAMSEWSYGVTTTESYWSGYAVIGSTLYSGTLINRNSEPEPVLETTPVGGGWGNYTYIERAYYEPYLGAPTTRSTFYGLRSDGVIQRWKINPDTNSWGAPTAFAGFSSVQAMTLIAETATYDTFLAVTHGGALYTIRIPLAATAPIVTKVRASGWSGIDVLVAERCGQYGTLLTGIDKDTGKAYLYAVGHANGTATVINSLGQVPGTFQDPVYHLGTYESVPPLNGD